jgi:hypothetical protein
MARPSRNLAISEAERISRNALKLKADYDALKVRSDKAERTLRKLGDIIFGVNYQSDETAGVMKAAKVLEKWEKQIRSRPN